MASSKEQRSLFGEILDWMLAPLLLLWPMSLGLTGVVAQEIAARHALRPRNPAILKKHSATFKPIQLFTVQEVFGSLEQAQKIHFNDGGQFDRLYTVK